MKLCDISTQAYIMKVKRNENIWPHLTCSFNKIGNCTNNTSVENRHKSGFTHMVSTNSSDLPLWKNTSLFFFIVIDQLGKFSKGNGLISELILKKQNHCNLSHSFFLTWESVMQDNKLLSLGQQCDTNVTKKKNTTWSFTV